MRTGNSFLSTSRRVLETIAFAKEVEPDRKTLPWNLPFLGSRGSCPKISKVFLILSKAGTIT